MKRGNAPFEIEGLDGRRRELDLRPVAAADELDAFDRGRRLVADAEQGVGRSRRHERPAHGDAVDRDFEPGADAVRGEGVAPLQRAEQVGPVEACREDAGEAALARGDLCEAGMAIVGIAAADEAEPRSVQQHVAHEIALDRLVDRSGRVGGLARAVDGDDLGHRLELGVRREVPVGRDGRAGGVVGEGEHGAPTQRGPELVGAIARRIEGGEHRELVVEGEDVAVAVEPARPFVAGQRDESAWLVIGLREGEDFGLARGILVEGRESPVVVVGERDDVEAGHVPGIPEVVVRGTASVGITRVAVEIRPDEMGRRVAHDDRR